MKTPARFLAACLLLTATASADVQLAPLFSDHAVLQRDQPVPVWGTADPGEQVTVSFAGQELTTEADHNGSWRVELSPMPASAEGRPLTVAGKLPLTLNDILVGDVWLCGGQSNMEWPVRMSNDAEAEAAAADYPLIRQIRIERRIARDPLDTAEGSWVVCSPDTVPHFTAVGYFHARKLHHELGVPIGLVNSNWGGTPVEAWLPARANADPTVWADALSHQAKSNENFAAQVANYAERIATWQEQKVAAEAAGETFTEDFPGKPWTPGAENAAQVLYNGMIAPLEPAALAGVIWYQGEANADQPDTYHNLFSALIESWREGFKQPDLPFYWVQLANWAPNGDSNGTGWAFLREAQTQTLALPHTGQAVIIDVGDPADIHPRNKQAVGDRLARLALARQFGRDVVDTGPVMREVTFEGATAVVAFDHADGITTTDDAAPTGFEVAGEDGEFSAADAQLMPDGRIQLSNAAVAQPTEVRYAWRDCPTVNLVNAEGLPAVPFRTDQF